MAILTSVVVVPHLEQKEQVASNLEKIIVNPPSQLALVGTSRRRQEERSASCTFPFTLTPQSPSVRYRLVLVEGLHLEDQNCRILVLLGES
jgi:hypothetical protein